MYRALLLCLGVRRPTHAPHKVLPRTAEFGGCSPPPTWRITKGCRQLVLSILRHFASCFGAFLRVPRASFCTIRGGKRQQDGKCVPVVRPRTTDRTQSVRLDLAASEANVALPMRAPELAFPKGGWWLNTDREGHSKGPSAGQEQPKASLRTVCGAFGVRRTPGQSVDSEATRSMKCGMSCGAEARTEKANGGRTRYWAPGLSSR